MFRLIVLVCLIHISVGNIIHGRISLNGDVNPADPIAADSNFLKPWLKIKQLSWPELVGRESTYAVKYIKERTGFTNVIIVPEGSAITMDYRTDRVRVFVNKKGVVTRIPRNG